MGRITRKERVNSLARCKTVLEAQNRQRPGGTEGEPDDLLCVVKTFIVGPGDDKLKRYCFGTLPKRGNSKGEEAPPVGETGVKNIFGGVRGYSRNADGHRDRRLPEETPGRKKKKQRERENGHTPPPDQKYRNARA